MRLRSMKIALFAALVASLASTTSALAQSSGQSAYDIFGLAPEGPPESPATQPAAPEPLLVDRSVDQPQAPVDQPAEETQPALDQPVEEAQPPADQSSDGSQPPAEQPVAEQPVVEQPAAEAPESLPDEDEVALLAEIERLVAERDELYAAILLLEEENRELRSRDSDAKAQATRVLSLESRIAELEELVRQKDEALALADARLVEIEALLAEEGAARADAEERLAEARIAASGDDEAALTSLLKARDDELAAKDASLAAKDADLATLAGELSARDERIAAIEAKLAAAEAGLAKAQADLAAAQARPPAAPSIGAPAGSSIDSAAEALAVAERRVAAIAAERDAAIAARDAAEAARMLAETSRRLAEEALAAAKASGAVVAVSPATGSPKPAAPASAAPAKAGYLDGWRLDTARFSRPVRQGFESALPRIGSWRISGASAAQTDAAQYFSRLEMPVAQGKAPLLYRFKARSAGKGWVGLGLHFYVEDVKKKRGYGEGKSLLVWFTRDKAARGDEATYLQLYRSDDDVVMERMFDAELADGLETWRLVEIVYDPNAEYIAVSVDGVLRVVYKTFFGRDSGATVSLRTLGGGGAFSDFSAWTE